MKAHLKFSAVMSEFNRRFNKLTEVNRSLLFVDLLIPRFRCTNIMDQGPSIQVRASKRDACQACKEAIAHLSHSHLSTRRTLGFIKKKPRLQVQQKDWLIRKAWLPPKYALSLLKPSSFGHPKTFANHAARNAAKCGSVFYFISFWITKSGRNSALRLECTSRQDLVEL